MKNSKTESAYKRSSRAVLALLRRKNLSVRLRIGFILMTVLPVLAVGWFSYASGSRAIYEKMSRSITLVMNQFSVNLSYRLQSIINDGTEIAYSDLVQSALSNYSKLSVQDINDAELRLSDEINKKYIFNNRVAEITLYTTHLNKINAYGPSDFRFIPKDEYLNQWAKEAGDIDGRYLWVAVGPEAEQGLAGKINKNRKSIVMMRTVKSLKDGNRIGFILMRIDEEQFRDIYGNMDAGAGAQMFILNSENKVISSAGSYGKFSEDYPEPKLLSRMKTSVQKSFDIKVDGRSCLAAFDTLKQADWYVVTLVPFSYLYSDSESLLYEVFLFALLALLFGLCMSFIIYRSIMTPVRQLVYGINSFKNGNLDVSVDDRGNDEFSELNRCFNAMAANTNQLIADIKEQEVQKRDLEIRALQAQINPHFLANALNMVSYVASLKKETNIVQMINSILTLLNGCMRNDSSFITVEEEITFLKSYLSIQEARLLGSFSVQYDVDPSIYLCRIPRFLLQPVVENALIHGIEPAGNAGLIVIKGLCCDGKLQFSVTDNGVGMNKEQIDRLLSYSDDKDKERLSGIGIANVRDRIELLYGPEYGLRINSIEGVFTTVDIYLSMLPPHSEDRV